MDEGQRLDVAKRVRDAREALMWTNARLAQVAGVAPNTVSAIENAREVKPSSLGKVWMALGLQPLEAAIERDPELVPQEVQLVTDALKYWLMGKEGDDRAKSLAQLLDCVIQARVADEVAQATRPEE